MASSNASAQSQARPGIQGLRAVAVILVVLFHSGVALPGGFVGVDVFFVISGYVITLSVLRELRGHGTLSLARFYERRVSRLAPAFMLAAAFTFVGTVLFVSPISQPSAAKTGAASALWLANFHLYRSSGGYFDPADEGNPFLHNWSLSVEEQFYLVMPPLFALAWRLGKERPVRAVVATFAALAAVSFTICLMLGWSLAGALAAAQERFGFYSPISRAWEFASGVVLAALAPRLEPGATSSRVLAVAGLVMVLAASLLYGPTTPFPSYAALLPVAGALALLATSDSPLVESLLGSRVMVFLGDLSYSWYLWHWPMIVFSRAIWPGSALALPIAALLSLAPAWASFALIETPLRRSPRIVGARALALVGASMAGALTISAIIQRGAAIGWGMLSPAELESQAHTRSHLDNCTDPRRAGGCLYDHEETKGDWVVLLGDSHADAISDAVASAARDVGAPYAVWSPGGCLFLKGVSTSPSCADWQRRAMRWTLDLKPRVVVIAGYVTGRITGINSGAQVGFQIQDGNGRGAATRDEARALYESGLRSAVEELESGGASVVVVSSIPDFEESPLEHWSVARPWLRSSEVSIETMRSRLNPAFDAESEVQAATQLRVLDPMPWICSDICSQRRDGLWLYRDTDHLSPAGAERLRPALRALFESTK